MWSVLASSAVVCVFEPWSGPTIDYEIGICCWKIAELALSNNHSPNVLSKNVIRRTNNTMIENQNKNYQRTKNGRHSTTQETKDWVTRTPLRTGSELRCFGKVGSSCSTRKDFDISGEDGTKVHLKFRWKR